MATTVLYERTGSVEYQYSVSGTTINCSGSVYMKVTTTDSELRAGSPLKVECRIHDSGGEYDGTRYYDLYGYFWARGQGGQVSLSTDPNGGKTATATYNVTYSPSPASYARTCEVAAYCYGTYTPTGITELEYAPNTAPTVSFSIPANIYAGSTVSVSALVSDYDSDECTGTLYAVYKVGNTTNRITLSSNLKLGTTTVNVQIPSNYNGGTVYFEAVVKDKYNAQTSASSQTKNILVNSAPTATFNITGVYPGNTANIAWVYSDPEGHEVSTISLERYYQAKNSTTWNKTALTVSSSTTSVQDAIPLAYNGGSVYYLLKFQDEYGAVGTKQSSSYQLQTVTAPTAPASITYPLSINGGDTITISWGASTDVENNIAGYEVDRTYNGTSWTNVYRANQPNVRTTTSLVEFGQDSVIYRVRAFDSTGMYSDYTIGNTATIHNNQKPSVPSSITVPSSISTGQSIVIKWGASTDPDGDTITYVLERKVNGGSYAVVAQTANLNYTDTVGSSWTTVQYRVKAVDSYGASSQYKESASRTVNQNRIPTITCQYSDGTDLGVKSEVFTFTFSVNDQDQSDTLTVKEYIDDTQFYTFTATRNTTYTFDFLSGARWDTLVNGSHKITITVSDTKATKSLSLYFVKSETGCSITLTEPLVSADDMYYVVFSVSYTLPYDNLWTDENTFNMALFNQKFANIDVLCVGASDEPDVSDWETCKIDTTSTVTKKGTMWQQGNNLVIPIREGNIIIIHKFTSAGKKFNYRIIADTSDVTDLGHICSVQGAFGFASITFPSWS